MTKLGLVFCTVTHPRAGPGVGWSTVKFVWCTLANRIMGFRYTFLCGSCICLDVGEVIGRVNLEMFSVDGSDGILIENGRFCYCFV